MTALIEQDIETSHRLFEIIEDGDWFEPIGEVNSQRGKYMSIEYLSEGDDGIFPLVVNWVNFANRIDKYGPAAFLDWAGKGKTEIDYGYCTIIREGKYSHEATLVFKEPITVVFGKVGDRYITEQVSRIKGEFDYEWGWLKHGRQDKIANTIEIYFNCKSFE